MAYIRNPAYVWGMGGEEKRDDDTICVSLPRGRFRGEPGGCDFRRVELLATALAFLQHDYPEMLTEAGSKALRALTKEAERDRIDGWQENIERLRDLADRDPGQIAMLLMIGLNPEDWAEDLFNDIERGASQKGQRDA